MADLSVADAAKEPARPAAGSSVPRRFGFWAVAYALFITLLGSNIPTPLYVVYQSRWHFSAGVLTILFATYVGGVLVALLFLGRLSDQKGRRRVLLPAVWLVIASTALFVVAQGVAWLLAARFIIGLAVGMATGTATAALVELDPRGDSRHAARISSAAASGGIAISPLLAGLLAQYAPWPTVLVFVAFLVSLAPALLGVWTMPETVQTTDAAVSLRPQLGVPRSIRGPFAVAAAAVFCAFSIAGMFSALTTSFVAGTMHVHNLAVGGAIVFVMLGTSAATQMVVRAMPDRRAMIIGPALLTCGLLLVVLALATQAVALLLAGALCAGVGHGLTFMGSLRLVNRVAPPSARGAVASTYFLVAYLGVGVPVLGIGLAAGYVGLFNATLAFAALIGGLALTTEAAIVHPALQLPAATSRKL